MKKLQVWPVALCAVFVLFFCAQAVLITLASSSFEGPDDVHYYRHGLEYDRQMRQARRQVERGWTLSSNLPSSLPAGRGHALRVELRDAEGRPLEGARVEVELRRPATRSEDVALVLRGEGPAYVGTVTAAPGAWDVRLTARLRGETHVERVRAWAR